MHQSQNPKTPKPHGGPDLFLMNLIYQAISTFQDDKKVNSIVNKEALWIRLQKTNVLPVVKLLQAAEVDDAKKVQSCRPLR